MEINITSLNHTHIGWELNSSVVNGLPDVGSDSTITVFDINGKLHAITSNFSGTMNGFSKNGGTWVSNSTIVNGISSFGVRPNPVSFYLGTNLNILLTRSDGGYPVQGYSWNNGGWDDNSTIESGISSCIGTDGSQPTIFNLSNTDYMIYGLWNEETQCGFNWTGSTWQQDDAIINNLGSLGDSFEP